MAVRSARSFTTATPGGLVAGVIDEAFDQAADGLSSKELRDQIWKLIKRGFLTYIFNPRKAFDDVMDFVVRWLRERSSEVTA
jgi:hypothetical protein